MVLRASERSNGLVRHGAERGAGWLRPGMGGPAGAQPAPRYRYSCLASRRAAKRLSPLVGRRGAGGWGGWYRGPRARVRVVSCRVGDACVSGVCPCVRLSPRPPAPYTTRDTPQNIKHTRLNAPHTLTTTPTPALPPPSRPQPVSARVRARSSTGPAAPLRAPTHLLPCCRAVHGGGGPTAAHAESRVRRRHGGGGLRSECACGAVSMQ